MNFLVTAGNTQVPIDRVRALTNVFTGRTGTSIAQQAHARGHAVTLLTSHPELATSSADPAGRWTVSPYRTFDELEKLLADHVMNARPEAIIHSAAVSDYRVAGVYAPMPKMRFNPQDGCWEGGSRPRLRDMAAAKIKSDAPELWLRLVRTPKLIDRIRADWGHAGILVKFKLEVGIREEQLLEVAERSRRASAADLMVANTLEGMSACAYLGPLDDRYVRVARQELAQRLLEAVERLHWEKTHG
jgi:phosphopantothenoylcysteine synthetase/decarboxylase